MSCLYLHGEQTKRCAAVCGLVTLSIEELETYCESGDYRACPVFREREKAGHLIPMKTYCSIFFERQGSRSFGEAIT